MRLPHRDFLKGLLVCVGLLGVGFLANHFTWQDLGESLVLLAGKRPTP